MVVFVQCTLPGLFSILLPFPGWRRGSGAAESNGLFQQCTALFFPSALCIFSMCLQIQARGRRGRLASCCVRLGRSVDAGGSCSLAHMVSHGRADWGVDAVGTSLGTAVAAGISRVPRLTCRAGGCYCLPWPRALVPLRGHQVGGEGSGVPVFRIAFACHPSLAAPDHHRRKPPRFFRLRACGGPPAVPPSRRRHRRALTPSPATPPTGPATPQHMSGQVIPPCSSPFLRLHTPPYVPPPSLPRSSRRPTPAAPRWRQRRLCRGAAGRGCHCHSIPTHKRVRCSCTSSSPGAARPSPSATATSRSPHSHQPRRTTRP